jgi:HTH-type transcriptional regulator/antitoxin HigA
MTLTINPSDYVQLLAKYQPKVIETEAENDAFG